MLARNQIVLAPTQFSTTAPLKLLSKQSGFRAATMPGFSRAMIPALRLDYQEINRRVNVLKAECDKATGCAIQFAVDDRERFSIDFDLRFRSGHASGGRFPDEGTAGNLPSGECYIVPYEGELEAPSGSRGVLPVQFGDEVVLYRIEANKAVTILSDGEKSAEELKKIQSEPAYANIAEIGFGVLKDFEIEPIGVILIDEKLGLHIAFGRSDHFGGAVGVKDFSSPEAVIHIDRIYIPETQPRVHPDHVILQYEDGSEKMIMEDGQYTLFDQ
jgi:leucyl aminopeptidase (aminopeptidase T)